MRNIHPTMARLYEAARELYRVEGPANLARLLNESPQLINTWERRGISSAGILKVSAAIGCRAEWLKDNEGPMVEGSAGRPSVNAPPVRLLLKRISEAESSGNLSDAVIDVLNRILDLTATTSHSAVSGTPAAASHAAAAEAAELLKQQTASEPERAEPNRRGARKSG
ncbi:hypothetical protein ACTXHA_03975 [Burkholderia cenocepacia]